MNFIDYSFYFIMLALVANYFWTLWVKYGRVNRNVVDGDKLMDAYISLRMRGRIK